MVLLELMPQAEGARLPRLLYVHWLLNRDFFSKSEPCSMCSKSWTNLVQVCVEVNISTFNGAYECNFLDGSQKFLVHCAMLKCPLCARSRVDHLIAFFTDGVTSIVTDESVQQPGEAPWKEESFSLSRCLSALADTYPNHFASDLAEWKEGVSGNNGDAVFLLIPIFLVLKIVRMRSSPGHPNG